MRTETRGAAQKAVFGYLLGPAVQGAARSYEQFPLNNQVRCTDSSTVQHGLCFCQELSGVSGVQDSCHVSLILVL